jgi:hypothetical protein
MTWVLMQRLPPVRFGIVLVITGVCVCVCGAGQGEPASLEDARAEIARLRALVAEQARMLDDLGASGRSALPELLTPGSVVPDLGVSPTVDCLDPDLMSDLGDA